MSTILPIQIFSVYKLQEIINEGGHHYSHCISIGDPETKEPNDIQKAFVKVLRLNFHDIDKKSDMPAENSPVTPKMQDIRKVITFFNRTKKEATGYTIHCHAGVHRSVAVGFIILYMMYGSVERANEELIRIKAFPLPNKRMITLFDKIYKSALKSVLPELERRLKDFLEDRISINHDDYLEEL